MEQRGRKSAAELAIPKASEIDKMPDPPSNLTDAQSDIWRLVVASRGGDLIAVESYPVLVEYCRNVVAANEIAALIDKIDVQNISNVVQLKHYDKLLIMQDRASARVAYLATKLRLTPSSRIQPITAGRNARKGAKVKPWESEDD